MASELASISERQDEDTLNVRRGIWVGLLSGFDVDRNLNC